MIIDRVVKTENYEDLGVKCPVLAVISAGCEPLEVYKFKAIAAHWVFIKTPSF